jgi:hypothetical protein
MGNQKQPKQSKFFFGNEQLQRDAGSLSMFTPLGTSDTVKSYYTEDSNGETHNLVARPLPGIGILDYSIVPGLSGNGASAINIAAKKLYTFVRHQNSGSRNYDSPDLMNYVFSVISAYAFLAQCIRAYAATLRYSSTNRYYGKLLVNALGFNYDNLSMNLATFRTMINVNISKLNALKIPADWNLLTRNLAFNLGLYKDGDIDKSQIYAYRSNVIWQYNETGTYVGCLTPIVLYGQDGSTILNMIQLQTIFDTFLGALVASEDINIMSGDILKAYGDSCYKMDLIPEGITIDPVYDKDMITLFHNVHFTKPDYSYNSSPISGFIISQSGNDLLFNPEVAWQLGAKVMIWDDTDPNTDYPNGARDWSLTYFDFDIDSVEPKDILLAALGTQIVRKPTKFSDAFSGSEKLYYTSIGTELFGVLRVFYSAGNVAINDLLTSTEIAVSWSTTASPYVPSWLATTLEHLSKFDWSPLIYFTGHAYSDDKGEGETLVRIYGDMYNYTFVNYEDITKMHQAIILSSMNLDR